MLSLGPPHNSFSYLKTGRILTEDHGVHIIRHGCGALAQLVEQLTLNQRVRGSSPLRLTRVGGSECPPTFALGTMGTYTGWILVARIVLKRIDCPFVLEGV